ncbi:tol-pal system protein YbgF [Silicimonas algicola]|uniref:Cell division coordinator CpoB n=1 Tax=Silicimonas algicola TaxID=1826607 RepID=A0A316GCQ8_9RHOB|nr:tol-pal system protein YbgF [Silicimonas algicola]AZQ66397.1 tol-pal system protein YbgF [Silicimonas algicola]PWK58731.1 tol-pal system protein YbgF [Silicimonas algicola]
MRFLLTAAFLFVSSIPGPVFAQDRTQTLADIRQELSVLYVEMQKLKRELSTTGGANPNLAGTNALDRLNSMEAELQRVTSQTEELTNRVNSVVSDGTNRIGDLEFRLCELEANCDIGSLGETSTLGGGAMPTVSAPTTPPASGQSAAIEGGGIDSSGIATGIVDTGGMELAVAEREDFDRAKTAYDQGDWQAAADRLQAFTDTYQGGPLTGLAHLMRGESLTNLGMTSSAARAYLESYSGTPDGPTAPTALLKLGVSLGGLGQSQEACITLAEVTTRFPTSEASIEAQTARANMGCS